jgi:hypothetical protein
MNITLSVDDRLIAKARRLARERGTSVNQLVREYLEQLVRPRPPQDFGKELRRLTQLGETKAAGWVFDRDELHERR